MKPRDADLTTIESAEQHGSVAAALLTPEAVRQRCGLIFKAAQGDRLDHFALAPGRLEDTARYVVETMRANYPDLNIPFHSRWRHLCVESEDRWLTLAADLDTDALERARIRFDLAVTSVLLDAGAGDHWRYRDERSGTVLTRSEGLAIASFDMFGKGRFSANPDQPLRADAEALSGLSVDDISQAFQVKPDNPLAGLEGRTALLQRLGRTLAETPRYFGSDRPRIGNLVDYLVANAAGREIAARDILIAVLESLGSIWPGRITVDGINLGDTWRHPMVTADDATDGLVPFHKLSQWLTYSLLEPLEEAGFTVNGLDALTGLAEYRNGGLLIDLGLIAPKHDGVVAQPHEPGSQVVVEWRALTIALIDQVADEVRRILSVDQRQLPLASILEGGTWSAGRRAARERRADGRPPIAIISDGSVF